MENENIDLINKIIPSCEKCQIYQDSLNIILVDSFNIYIYNSDDYTLRFKVFDAPPTGDLNPLGYFGGHLYFYVAGSKFI